ncbi:hypothetical protein KI387_030959, partial [Taxus chinensis]
IISVSGSKEGSNGGSTDTGTHDGGASGDAPSTRGGVEGQPTTWLRENIDAPARRRLPDAHWGPDDCASETEAYATIHRGYDTGARDMWAQYIGVRPHRDVKGEGVLGGQGDDETVVVRLGQP